MFGWTSDCSEYRRTESVDVCTVVILMFQLGQLVVICGCCQYNVMNRYTYVCSAVHYCVLDASLSHVSVPVNFSFLCAILQLGHIACNAERCISHGNSVCLSVFLSVRHTLVPYSDE